MGDGDILEGDVEVVLGCVDVYVIRFDRREREMVVWLRILRHEPPYHREVFLDRPVPSSVRR